MSGTNWVDIPNYEGIYQINPHGDVRRVPRSPAYPAQNRLLSPWKGSTGYMFVTLYKDGHAAKYRVHRLVATVFLEDPKDGREVCHRDDNRTNNDISNLYWGTHAENMRDMVRNGHSRNQMTGTTACANGHPYTPENTRTTKEGWRSCRTCRRERVRAWRARKAQA